ncbi:arsenic resistance N-acetyltransferase ArsN2 [Mucilaginibacter sp. SMC90]|uniref:arsenic resistance N-acetyltransferase ArsN2 n=1 Tax=Mucilaginibacter sp. SMC90 TaxID=2929803 RepID=UPI001FB2A2D3|nr:arsenic resistance N-acetyltransferase ArsN2 [Mucilaginibacter sp. SMC90]UOE49869.1 arsenic resistance N-acetyltransferase ArsN2 [Mucilaginibacter sp. SMC90]
MTIENAQPYREQVIELLSKAKLPVVDLPAQLNDFNIAMVKDKIAGIAGIEVYGTYGLLRSVAVLPEFLGKGIAGKLIDHIITFSSEKGLSTLYLLTETATDYFDKKGFAKISREHVPVEVQLSSEFCHVCPASAK